jgi:demethylmenaquinone methyltransferase/2-methoxy-6-polyprenyl-1,4-benzoquinol methylase
MSGPEGTSVSQAERLRIIFRLTRPAIGQAVRALRIPAGSRGLDAGCGSGCHLELLGRQVGPTGRVTAFDLAFENLIEARAAYGKEEVGSDAWDSRPGLRAGEGAPLRPAVDFVQGDICRLPFDGNTFDWIWCADTLWGGTAEEGPAAVVAEFARVVRPRGKIAFLYWSSQSLLPGYPVLEARLNEAFVRSTPYLAGVAPQHQHLRALDWLREAGLRRPRAKTFLADIKAPVDQATREALAVCFDMFWGDLEEQVSAAEWEAYLRLCAPDSPDFVGSLPGYYAFITYTMYWGIR